MKTTYIVIGIIVVVAVIGGIFWYTQNKAQAPTSPTAQTASTTATAPIATSTSATSAVTAGVTVTTVTTTTATPTPESFTVNGNDETADLKTITVKKGTPVSITFGADAGTTYHGGLDFRSSVVNTGTITPGSTKTVTFTAEQSFAFTPYWPATNIAKPYTINIIVD
jgi:hypothetical protein